MANTQSQGQQNSQHLMQQPPMYHVIMHNDDVTTMDFVVMLLMQIFRKSETDAETIMLKIHNEGSAIVGTYYKDIALSKARVATELARDNNFPLQITTEEAQ